MRVSTSMVFAQGLSNLQQQQSAMLQSQQEIATGVKLTNPAQDPVAFSTASDLSVLSSKQNQYSTNIDNATGKIQVQESTLGSITTMLQSVRDVAIQANNAAQNGTSLSALTDQLDQLQKALAGQMNATDERGEYLFSGTAAREKPYDASGVLNPAVGSAGTVKLAISDQQSVGINQPAGQIFQLSSSATTGGNASILQVIDQLKTAITTQPANLQTVYENAQKDIDAVMNQVTDARGSMGNALNTLSTAKNDNAAQNVLTQQTLSGLRDTDVASAITKLNQSYLNLQATQQSMVKIQSLSLFNYIR
ncbi:flagellar hook-associated protein FlgL [Halothiobacillus sp.]|uniref:flagellar hook-associated protein FlgL n=1 Tax=Halothiobacillus sp. TaxID=1891311 RepID=UPI002636BA4F|nr:flagellar hook-associated protein FlgL [Halothiobacillus sp.]MDD3576024.1 flagellar hook-associated protein FlgL [Halothiobacillus sp.]MDD4966900.1 flagellar hook-associated protein FlgL [Halothiobacillus sp.]